MVKMEDFLLQYFMQLRFNEMPPEIFAQFKDYAKNDDFRGNMKNWKKYLMHINSDGELVPNDLPNPAQVGGAYELSEDDWKDLFREFQSAFRKMDANRKNYINTVNYNANNQDAIDFLDEYFGFGRLFDKATASPEAEQDISVLADLLKNHENVLKMKLSEWDLLNDNFTYTDLQKGIKNQKYNTDSDFQSKLKNVAYYITTYTTNPYYKDDDLINALGQYDFSKIQDGFDDKLVDPNKLNDFKTEYDILLRRLASKDKIRDVFPSDKIKSAFDTAKSNIAYDDKGSKDYIPPKRADELTLWQQLKKQVGDTYADVFDKYVKFTGDRLYFSAQAKQIINAIHKAEVKPTDGIEGVLKKATSIKDALLYKSPTAKEHFEWLEKTMSELKDSMPKAFEGALRNGRQMRALIEEMIMIAVRDGKEKEAKSAMEVLSVIKYGYTTSKIMDTLGKEELSLFSDKGLSWNKNEGVKIVTQALDKSIKTAFMGVGYGITIVGNAINLSGNKFKGKRGRMTGVQKSWEQQNQDAKNAAIADQTRNNTIAINDRTAEETRKNATGITDATIDQHKHDQEQGKIDEENKKTQLDNATNARDNAQSEYDSKRQVYDQYQSIINKYDNELPQKIDDLQQESDVLKTKYTAIKNQLSAITTPYANSMEELRAKQLQKKYDILYEERKQKLIERRNLIQTLNAGKANGGEYQTAQLNIATATTEERAASAALATANTAYQNAERDYNSVRSANQTRDDKISEFEQANKRISELNEQINRRNEIVNTWDEKHKDKYKELMAYWDMLETGRDSHMGKMYNWGGRSLSAKSAQDKFDNKKQGYINDYLNNYTYRA